MEGLGTSVNTFLTNFLLTQKKQSLATMNTWKTLSYALTPLQNEGRTLIAAAGVDPMDPRVPLTTVETETAYTQAATTLKTHHPE
jgi:hypothetical protein